MHKFSSNSSFTKHRNSERQLLPLVPVEFKVGNSEKHLPVNNPFSLPGNDVQLYHNREFERVNDEKYRKAIKYYPIEERHTFTQAPSVLKDFKKEILDSDVFALPSVGSRRNLSSKKETIKEFIQRKREILLVKKNIENKKSKFNELEDDIARKEEKHKANIKKLEDNKGRVAKYEEEQKQNVDHKAKQAEEISNKRSEKQKKLKNLQDEIDSLKAKVDRKIDEQKTLEDYKQFVDELIPDTKAGVFLTENHSSLKTSAKMLEEGINSLETTNLFQIQQAQEDEQELEALRHQNNKMKLDKLKIYADSKARMHYLEIQHKTLEEKLKKIANAEEIEAPVNENSSRRVHEELISLFQLCGGDLTNNPKELEMLETIEKAFDICLMIKENKAKEELKKKEREIDRERRTEKIDKERLNLKEKTEKSNKTNQGLKDKVVKRIGRNPMKRSKLHEKIEVIKLPDEPQDVLDRREFLEINN